MASPARVVLEFLRATGHVLVTGEAGDVDWPAVAGKMPGDGARYVSVMNSGGMIQGRDQRSGAPTTFPRIQVMVRAEDDAAASERCEAIVNELSKVGTSDDYGGWGFVPLMVEGEDWALKSVKLLTVPMPVGYEKDKDLILYSINFQVTAERVTPENIDYLYPAGGYG